MKHIVHIKLRPGKGITYSMGDSCWAKSSGRLVPARPDAEMGMYGGIESNQRQITEEAFLGYAEKPGDWHGYQIEEEIEIIGIPMERAISVREYQDEQLHEIKQSSVFPGSKDNATHQTNGPIEMPADLLCRAIDLAIDVPFNQGSEFAKSVAGVLGGFEQHPAMKLLCDWWETVRPKGEPYKPGMALPYVRVRDDGEYWCADQEMPNAPVDDFNPDGRNAARVGDSILMLFIAKQENLGTDAEGVTSYLPSGVKFLTVGVSMKDYLSGDEDEAWRCLCALAAFPETFPAAWKFMKSRKHETAKKRRKSHA